MDQRDRELLEETLEYTKENNKMLKKMRGAMRWNSFVRFIVWVVVIATTLWFYYRFEPIITEGLHMFENVKANLQSLPASQ